MQRNMLLLQEVELEMQDHQLTIQSHASHGLLVHLVPL